MQKKLRKQALLLTKAFSFAAQKHVSQKRKGAAAEPYINHPAEVADLISQNTKGKDVVAIVAGILHDTIEDTQTTYTELKKHFGKAVADVVRECTDDKSLPKAERKRLQAENAPHKSKQAKKVKMADKISNLRAILTTPPEGWDAQRKIEYFAWTKTVVDGCRDANAGLAKEYDRTYKRGMAQLKQQQPA